MSMSLYQVTQEGMLLEELLTESMGELTPELEARMDELMAGGSDKIHAAVMVVKKILMDAELCRAEAAPFKAEAERLEARAKSHEKNAESLKSRIVIALDAAFGGKIKSATMTAYTQKAADKISIALAADVDASELAKTSPMLMTTNYSINNAAVKDHKKLTGSYPAEFAVEETPGRRFLQVK